MHSPVSLTIAADATANLRHHTRVALRVPLTDSGTKPLTVSMHVEDVTRLARQYPGASWVRSITPARLTLKPGQTAYETLHVVVPAGARGTHYVNYVAQSAPLGHGGTGQLGAGVGGTMTMRFPGFVKALTLKPPPHFVAPLPPSGPPTVWLVAAGLSALVLLLGFLLLVLRRRRTAGGA